MLATLMLRIQCFQLAQIGDKLHLHEYGRITGCGSLHFRRVGGLTLDIVNHALQQVPPLQNYSIASVLCAMEFLPERLVRLSRSRRS